MNQDVVDQNKQSIFERIKTFVTSLTRTQIIGFFATVNIVLLFAAWLYVPILSSLSNVPILGGAISPYVKLSETVFSLESTVNKAENTFNKVVDAFEVKEEEAQKGQKLVNEMNLVSTLLGVDLKEYGISLDDIKIEEGNLLFDDQDVQKVRDVFAFINGIIDPIVGCIAGIFLLCFGFDLYAAVMAFKNKKVTIGTFSAFIIQGVIVLAVFFACMSINVAVQKEIFFINKTITPSAWAWIILVVSVVGFYLSLKEYRSYKTVVKAEDADPDPLVLSETFPVAEALADSEQSSEKTSD